MLSKFFGRSTRAPEAGDPLLQPARKLPGAAAVQAISCLNPFGARYPAVGAIPLETWQHFASAASVFMGIEILRKQVTDPIRVEHAVLAILEEVERRSKGSTEVVWDCRAFVYGKLKEDAPAPQESWRAAQRLLGTWVLGNCWQRSPNSSEREVCQAVGVLLSEPLLDWWR